MRILQELRKQYSANELRDLLDLSNTSIKKLLQDNPGPIYEKTGKKIIRKLVLMGYSPEEIKQDLPPKIRKERHKIVVSGWDE